jgi:MinD-like ATPase involved in chromosome partitioning or flagellar assembly
MMSRLVWCTPGRTDEAELIADVVAAGLTVARRCVDAADLLAAASIEADALVVVDADVPRLGADIVASVQSSHSNRVIGLAGSERERSFLRALGIESLIDPGRDEAGRVVAEALRLHRSEGNGAPSVESVARASGGHFVAVTGPPGAPGRSTVALGLAEQWARAGERVCLIDADTLGPSLACQVGMTEDVSGLLLAARYADQGALDARSLGASCRRLTDNLWFMSGIGLPERWSSVRVAAVCRIWSTCRAHFDRVVVDAGALLDTPEPDDPLQVRGEARDGITRSALGASTEVIVVCTPDPVSISRLLPHLAAVRSAQQEASVSVVVNRVPRRERNAIARVRETLAEAGLTNLVLGVVEDARVRECVRKGALLGEESKAVRVRRSLERVARAVAA